MSWVMSSFFVDEAGFNLTKTRRRGRNIIGHRAIINVPGQRGGNITMCAAISQMVLFTIMQPWAHITLHTLLHSWTPYMTCSLMFRDQSRPDTSSYGTMLVSIGLLWSATGYRSPTLHCTQPPPILSILESN